MLLGGRAARIDQLVRGDRTCVVHNLHVEDLHSFAVGEGGILVHNQGGTEAIRGKLAEKGKSAIQKLKGQKKPAATPAGKTPAAPVKITPPEHADLVPDTGNGMLPSGRTMESVGNLKGSLTRHGHLSPQPASEYTAHHIVPGSLYRDVPMLRDIGFKLDHWTNGIWVTKKFHPGRHEAYTKAMENILSKIPRPTNPEERAKAAEEVLKVMEGAKKVLNGQGTPLRFAEAQKANPKLTHDEFITMWEDAIRAAMP